MEGKAPEAWEGPLEQVGEAVHRGAERVYEVVAGEEDDRSCEAIPDEACREVPGSFVLNALNGASTKLAEQLASPGLVLPWLLGAVGAPAALVGLLVPVRRAGSLLPQLAVAARIRTRPLRKWFWVGAGLVQAVALAAMIPAILLLPATAAGLAVVAALGVFSVASGVGSVAFKDVMAKTIPRGRRGRLLGVRATVGGLLALAAAGGLRLWVAEDDSLLPYVALLAGAALLWILGAGFFAAIREVEGATGGGRNALEEARAGLHFLRRHPPFTRFVLARGLLLAAQLAVPFYALRAQELTGVEAGNLALFVMASSLAAVLSSPLWGKFSDASARRVMVAGGLWTAITIVLALSGTLLPENDWSLLLYSLVFLSSGFAVAGVRLGRKTYLLDGAPDRERPLMVAVANTVVGILYAAAAVLGLMADQVGVPAVLGVLGGMAVLGTLMSWRLPEAGELFRRVEEG
jgi:hypothetical protein